MEISLSNRLLSGVFIVLFISIAPARAQSDSNEPPHRWVKATFYYTSNWTLTSPENSFYIREANFDLNDMTFDGPYRDYTKDRILVAEGMYEHGERKGLQTEYYNNRKLKSTMEVKGQDFVIWELHDENQQALISSGSGAFTSVYFAPSGLASNPTWKQGILKGQFKRGNRTGTWTYTEASVGIIDEEQYDNGRLIQRVHHAGGQDEILSYRKTILIASNSYYTDAFILDSSVFGSSAEMFDRMLTYPPDFDRPITIAGGTKKMLRELAAAADIPEEYLSVVRVKLDENGKVKKMKLARLEGDELNERALQAVKAMEKRFLPAIQKGKPVSSTIDLPMSGGSNWQDVINQWSPRVQKEVLGDVKMGSGVGNLAIVILTALLIAAALI